MKGLSDTREGGKRLERGRERFCPSWLGFMESRREGSEEVSGIGEVLRKTWGLRKSFVQSPRIEMSKSRGKVDNDMILTIHLEIFGG